MNVNNTQVRKACQLVENILIHLQIIYCYALELPSNQETYGN
jgi:hypothetical protein